MHSRVYGVARRQGSCYDNTSLAYLENSDSICKFINLVDPTMHAKHSSISCTKLKFVQFRLILPKFVCHGNSLGSLENSGSIEFINPVNSTIHAKKSTISCTELKFVQFWRTFV